MEAKMKITNLRRFNHFRWEAEVDGVTKTLYQISHCNNFVTFGIAENFVPLKEEDLDLPPYFRNVSNILSYQNHNKLMEYLNKNEDVTFLEIEFDVDNRTYNLIDFVINK